MRNPSFSPNSCKDLFMTGIPFDLKETSDSIDHFKAEVKIFLNRSYRWITKHTDSLYFKAAIGFQSCLQGIVSLVAGVFYELSEFFSVSHANVAYSVVIFEELAKVKVLSLLKIGSIIYDCYKVNQVFEEARKKWDLIEASLGIVGIIGSLSEYSVRVFSVVELFTRAEPIATLAMKTFATAAPVISALALLFHTVYIFLAARNYWKSKNLLHKLESKNDKEILNYLLNKNDKSLEKNFVVDGEKFKEALTEANEGSNTDRRHLVTLLKLQLKDSASSHKWEMVLSTINFVVAAIFIVLALLNPPIGIAIACGVVGFAIGVSLAATGMCKVWSSYKKTKAFREQIGL